MDLEARIRAGVTGFMAVALLQLGLFSSLPLDTRVQSFASVVQMGSSLLFWSAELNVAQKAVRTWWRSMASDVGKAVLVLNLLRMLTIRVFLRTQSEAAARAVVVLAAVTLLYTASNYRRLTEPAPYKRAADLLSRRLDVDSMVAAVDRLGAVLEPAESALAKI